MRKIIIDNERNIREVAHIINICHFNLRVCAVDVTLSFGLVRFSIFLLPSNCNYKVGKACVRGTVDLIVTDCDKVISNNSLSLEFAYTMES